MTKRHWFSFLFTLAIATAAHADLDTYELYGNGADGVTLPGFVNNGGGSYSLTASGADIWGGSDHGAFLHEAGATTSGDFTAIVRSESFGGPDGLAGEWGRSGPMARADVSAANSANVMTVQKSGGGTGMVFQGRPSAGAGTDRNGVNGDFPNSGGANAAAGVPVWMALSRQGNIFIGHWAFDDGAGNPGAWSDAAYREVTPDLAGPVSVGLAHQAHSIPRVNTWNADNWSLGPFDPSLPVVTLPNAAPFVNVGPGPQSMGFGVRFVYYDQLGDINDVQQAIDVLNAGTGTIEDGTRQTANTADVGGSAGGGYTLPDPKDPFLNNPTQGVDTNDVVWLYNGILDIQTAGDYTFGFDGDDGQRLKVENADFTKQAGGGSVPLVAGGRDTVEFFGNTGDAFTTASTFLPVGQHRIQYIGYERGGGAFGELFAAHGVIGPGDPVQWLAIGSKQHVDEIVFKQPAILTSDARVINGADADTIPDARTAIDAATADWLNSPTGTAETIVIGENRIGGLPAAPTTHPFPNGGGDEFSTGVFGEFAVVDTDGAAGETLTFLLASDDGSSLHIEGGAFDNINATGDAGATSLEPIGPGTDVALTADFFTGNTNTFGRIVLDEGVYPFTAWTYEGGGGSGIEVWVAAGDHSSFNPAFYPLTTAMLADKVVPGNWALDLVPEPTGLSLVGVSLFALLGLRRRRS